MSPPEVTPPPPALRSARWRIGALGLGGRRARGGPSGQEGRRPPSGVTAADACVGSGAIAELQGKNYWTGLARIALNKLADVSPGSLPQDRSDFIADLEKNKTKMNHVKRQHDKKGRSLGDTLRDWFQSWLSARTSADSTSRRQGNLKKDAKDLKGKHHDAGEEDGWTVQARRRPTGRGTSAASATTTTTTTTRTPTSTTTSSSATRTTSSTRRGAASRGREEHACAWRDMEVAEETPLVDVATGTEAGRLDLDAPVEAATGYCFCNTDQAADLFHRLARAPNPITFILPPYGISTKDDIRKALEMHVDLTEGETNPGIVESTLFVKEPSGRKYNTDVLLVHIDRGQPILPPQQVDDGMLFTDALPSVNLDLPSETDLQFTVVAPICRELGLADWWEKLRGRAFPHFKDDIKRIISSAKFKPNLMRARQDRHLVWRGEHIEEGRISTSVKVPLDQVNDLLARSGRHGILIDRPQRGRERDSDDLARIKLPPEWTMTDALAKLDALPSNLRKSTRGIIPTARGYALRVCKEAEAEITAMVTPEFAAQMGPALGLRGTSSWVVCGIPRNAAKEGIIRALNAPSSRWRGWTVRPLRTISEPRGGQG